MEGTIDLLPDACQDVRRVSFRLRDHGLAAFRGPSALGYPSALARATVRRVTRTNPSLPALVVCGPPASGKSTLGRALAAALSAALLDQDVLTGPLTAVVARLVGSDDLDSPALAKATRAARYETLAAAAEDNLQIGRPVVLVAPYSTERRDTAAWKRVSERLSHAGGAPTLVWLHATGEELLKRMAARAAGRDSAKLADRAFHLARTDLSEPVVPHIAVDSTAGLDEQCGVVLASIS